MATRETPALPTTSAEHRRIAAERFDRANQVIAAGEFDYGVQLLLTCCKLDPANMLFRQTLRRTQKAKFGNNLRGSRLAVITTFRTRARLKAAKRVRDFAKVLEHGEEILSRNPWDMGVQMDMALAADGLGLIDMAIFILDQARQKYPKDPTLNRALARLFEKRGNFAHAIALWQQVKEVVPGDVEAAHKAKDLAASETIQRGQYDQNLSGEKQSLPATAGGPTANKKKDEQPVDRAARDAAPLLARIEANPTEATLYVQLSAVYRRLNQLDRARAVLEQGLGPTASAFPLQIGILEMDLEPLRRNLDIAEEKLRERAAKKTADDDDEDGPSLDDLRKVRHRLLKEINSREIEIFRLRADRFPQELAHRLELGARLLKADQVDEAIVELQQARKDQKLLGKASMHLGFCFKKRNNPRLALRNFEDAMANVPATDEANRKEIIYQLAKAYAETGDFAKAIELGHDLANLDFAFRDIGKLLDEWQERLQQA
jgi:tetratricopeptide (TPR) repeat protein